MYDDEGNLKSATSMAEENSFSYDSNSNLTQLIDATGTSFDYTYDSNRNLIKVVSSDDITYDITNDSYGNPTAVKITGKDGTTVVQYEYDGLGRRISTTYPDAGNYTNTITYKTNSDGTATTNPNVLTLGSDTYTYQYDTTNTLYGINRNSEGLYHGFYFDSLGQLIQESLKDESETIVYEYDTGGNITSKKHYSYTTGTPTTLLYTDTYTYGDSSWKDLLTAYNGESITYDAIGNALTWRDGLAFTWANGRQLATLTKTGTTASYTYDVDGIRTSKTVNGVTTTYYLNGSQILSQETGSTRMDFLYDENGTSLGLDYNGTRYYYITNLEGDIVKIINQSGTEVVKYTYDGWGVPTVSGSLASTLGQDNPFRFKGYYYDVESGMYYIRNRYYDPVISRWINSDNYNILLLENENLLQYNLFTYCWNNPIFMVDYNGLFPQWLSTTLKITAGVAIIAASIVLTTVTGGATAPLSVMITATVIGTVGGAATNAACQYQSAGGSWNNFDVDECITAGVAGGLSAVLATTGITRGGQMIGNAIISGANSIINGNSASDVIVDTCMGCGVGFFGGSGTGYGGLGYNTTLKNTSLLTEFGKGFVKSSIVSNIRNFTNLASKKIKDLYNYLRKR